MRESIAWRYARGDLRQNRAANAALAVLLVLSAFLMATGAMVMERMVASVDQLFAQARPPHFLQMHRGDYDRRALEDFAAANPEIESWLVEEMLGYDGAAIAWSRPATGESGDLSESLIDNLLVTQNHAFDFLLDATGAIPHPQAGEVYVPVAYQQRFDLRVGDELGVRTEAGSHDLRIEGFVRDAQMASSLSSATRFLISEADFAHLADAGGAAPEIIVEYRVSDPATIGDLQRAYDSDEALPRNGQAVTDAMIRTINAVSDGLVAVALMFVSLLLIVIAFLDLRFVIRGSLEEDVHEIGAMKAIGLPGRTITRLYLTRYRVLSLLGCLVGGLLAVPATALLTRTAQVSYAVAPPTPWTVLIPLLALGLVHLVVMGLCRRVLRAVRRIEVVGALVHGSVLDERATARRARRLARRVDRTSLAAGRGPVIWRLALLDLRSDARQWTSIPAVLALAAVLVVLPTNLLSTFSDPRFVTYLGAPESDVRADLQFSDDVDATRDELLAAMARDDRLEAVRTFATVLAETPGEEGWESLVLEVGDHTGPGVEILAGHAPGQGEIALSVLNARKYGVSPGDELVLRHDGEQVTLVVSGTYQDVTRGGYTAKLSGEVTQGAAGYVVYVELVDGPDAPDPATVAADYDARFPGAAVIPMREYVDQTMAYVTSALRRAAALSLVFGVAVVALITTMFLTLRLTRERRARGVLSAIGFSLTALVAQMRIKVFLALAVGALLGTVVAATAGEWLVGRVVAAAGLGIERLVFFPQPWLVYGLYPVLLLGAGYAGAVVLTARLRGADTSGWLRE